MVQQVSDVYAKKCNINRDSDWYLLKLQEELGELTQVHLKATSRGRIENQNDEVLKKNQSDEVADLLAHILLYAKNQKIDLDDAIRQKWLKWLG